MTQTASTPGAERSYPLNCWWVAATATEVTREPLERWLLDQPVVLYRTETGQPVALDNRCIHRWAPLSGGHLEGDLIVCPYHGARYAPDGRCVRYPTQTTVPATARVRSYAVVERGPFVWVWMGEDARRQEAEPPPAFEWATDPAWTVILNGLSLEANYMLLHENVLDLTHFNYLHKDSFKITDRSPPTYRIDGDRVFFNVVNDASDMHREGQAVPGSMDPFLVCQEEEAGFMTPALHSVISKTTRKPNPHLPEAATTYVHHLVTPETNTRSHYWWLIGVNPAMPLEMAEGMKAMVEVGYNEDKVMLAAIQAMIVRDPRGRDYPEFSFGGDTGGIQVRRALGRILARD